jgi:hypothetical protein
VPGLSKLKNQKPGPVEAPSTKKGVPAKYAHWSRSKRVDEAVKKVITDQWSQVAAAKEYGISRANLNARCQTARADMAAKVEKAKELTLQGVGFRIGGELRRIMPFAEFDQRYFGNWVCPDCNVHHATPKFHSEIVEALASPDPRTLILLPPYHAKVLALDTPVPTPSGWSTIGALRPGDELFDMNGNVTTVVALSPLIECTMRAVLGDGSEFLTDAGHRWWVEPRDARPRFVTTQEVLDSPHPRRFRVPLAGPLNLPPANLAIDPYALGAWLGDGTSASGSISAHPNDQAFMRSQFESAGFVTTNQPGSECRFGVIGLHVKLRDLGVSNNKHVPTQYLRGSIEQRLALLQGLMDTDGTVNTKAGNVSFTNTNELLADAVFELVATLGWKPRRWKGDAKLNGTVTGVYHEVSFCPSRDRSPFRMPRKTALLPPVRSRQLTRPFKTIDTVPTPVLGRCLAVSSPTQTFLVGRAMVPTGNSTLVTVKDTIYDLCKDPNSRTIIVSQSTDFAKTFLHSIDQLLTNPDLYEGAAGNLIEEWGPFKPEGDGVWNSQQIYVAGRVTAEKDPTVQVLGVGKQIYGRRADKIKFDDIASTENSRNPDQVAKMLSWIDKMALSRIGKSGKAIWVGTRVGTNDPYYTLMKRTGYKVIRYPTIFSDDPEEVLWPEHFPYRQAIVHRDEMSPSDFQLVYQNVDTPGLSASFSSEALDASKDLGRTIGHFLPGWRIVIGLDPAGGGANSGFTALVVLGIDVDTGVRYLIETINVKAMRAPQLKDAIFSLCDRYPVSELRVESNGVQSQIVQYNDEIIKPLARKGIRVVPHHTQSNKWDPQFGVESMAPLFNTGLMNIPWGNQPSATGMYPLVEQLTAFPMGTTTDLVMALWFADLAARDYLKRQHMPMFNERMRVPERVKRRRHVVNFETRQVSRVPLSQQVGHQLTSGQAGFQRMVVGTLTEQAKVAALTKPRTPPLYANLNKPVPLEGVIER